MINPWHKNEVDMIRTNTALHLDLSPQVGRNASSFEICRGRNRNRLTTRWSGPGMQRKNREKAHMLASRRAGDELTPAAQLAAVSPHAFKTSTDVLGLYSILREGHCESPY